MPYLYGSLAVGYAVFFTIAAYSQWTRAHAARRDLSVLRAIGCTSRQLDVVAAWQAMPLTTAATALGIPVGVALGRWSFTQFAHSLAAVERPSTTVVTIGALVIAVLAAATAASGVGLFVRRRTCAAAVMRAG